MKSNLLLVSVLILFIAIVASCSEELEKKDDATTPSASQLDDTRFPNKRSELAILMRNLNDELAANKEKIAKGEVTGVDWSAKYAALLSASPTDEGDSGPIFDGFAHKFISDLEAFENAPQDSTIQVYNMMIQSCLDCHQEHCHGPMTAIRKLKI